MGSENIYTIAQSIQPFIKGNSITTEEVYKIIMTNEHLSFIRDIFNPEDIPVLVFVSYEIAMDNDKPNIVNEIKNNLFYFNIFEFGDTENDLDCPECGGEGRDECGSCDGSGQITCTECNGIGAEEGSDTCDNCDGEGEIECNWCGGDGATYCDECSGRGRLTYYDEIPYELNHCVSYDKQLKVELDQAIKRNEPIYINPLEKNRSLILRVDSIGVGESSNTEKISKTYANDNYGGITLLPDEVTLRYLGSKMYARELDMEPDKFFN